MTFDNDWKPSKYVVFAELTENSHPSVKDKGYRYPVRLTGRRIDTIEDAEQAIKDDIAAIANPNTFGGLIDWGKSAPREYAIFEMNPTRVK